MANVIIREIPNNSRSSRIEHPLIYLVIEQSTGNTIDEFYYEDEADEFCMYHDLNVVETKYLD